MPVRAVVYVSRVARRMAPNELDALTASASSFNRTAGVTGVLLFDGARYLQYLEGPEDGVSSVYGRVVRATRHAQLEELAKDVIGLRQFPYWPMKLFQVDPIALGAIAHASWDGFTRSPIAGRRGAVDLLTELVDVGQGKSNLSNV